MKITALYVYPVKGAAPIALNDARLDTFGIVHDRRWMVVNERGEFMTQREDAQLGQIGTAVEGAALVLRSSRAASIALPLQPSGKKTRVRVWNDTVAAIDCGDDAAEFLAAHMGYTARLLYMPESTHRQADLEFATVGDRVSFADGYPMLLVGEGSLAALNARLEEPIPMMRFRPNVVVSDTAPYEEDTWRRIVLGDVACEVVKPCARCQVPTIDQSTATAGKEPMRTLATYRRWRNNVWFGQNVVHRGTGALHVGDSVEVLTTGPARPPL